MKIVLNETGNILARHPEDEDITPSDYGDRVLIGLVSTAEVEQVVDDDGVTDQLTGDPLEVARSLARQMVVTALDVAVRAATPQQIEAERGLLPVRLIEAQAFNAGLGSGPYLAAVAMQRGVSVETAADDVVAEAGLLAGIESEAEAERSGAFADIDAASDVAAVVAAVIDRPAWTFSGTPVDVSEGIAAFIPPPRWKVRSANYTAKAGDLIAASISGGGWTLTLPANPSSGEMVSAIVVDGDVSAEDFIIDGNGNDIHGESDLKIDVKIGSVNWPVRLVFNGTEWRL